MDMKELIKGYHSVTKIGDILKDGITVSPEEIASLREIADDIMRVIVHTNRIFIQIKLGGGNDLVELSQEERTYIEKAGNSLTIRAFPEAIKAILSVLEAVRKKSKKLCVGGSDLMSREVFENEFLPYLLKARNNLETIIENQIIDCFEDEMERFIHMVDVMTEKLSSKRRSIALKEANEYLKLTPEQIFNSFKISLETDFEELKGVSDTEIHKLFSEAKKEFVVKEGMSLISGTLKDLWEAETSYLKSIQKCVDGDLNQSKYNRTREKIRERAVKIRKENFCSISYIDLICKMLIEIENEDSRFLAEDDMANIMAITYVEAEKLDTELSFKDLPEWVTPDLLNELFDNLL